MPLPVDQTTSHAPPAAQTEDHPEGWVFTPDDVISSIIGADSIAMHGFGNIDTTLSNQIPNVDVDPIDEEAITSAIIKAERPGLMRSVLWLVLGTTVVNIAAYFVLTVFKSPAPVNRQTPITWHATRVTPSGLDVLIGQQIVKLTTGGVLPSGEPILAVDEVNQTYTTPTQVVSLTGGIENTSGSRPAAPAPAMPPPPAQTPNNTEAEK